MTPELPEEAVTEAMLEAGTCEAGDWLPRYAEMPTADLPGLCRAIYRAMRAATQPAMTHEVLLLASYCGTDNDACSEARPCADCLAMCNVFTGNIGPFLRELGPAATQPAAMPGSGARTILAGENDGTDLHDSRQEDAGSGGLSGDADQHSGAVGRSRSGARCDARPAPATGGSTRNAVAPDAQSASNQDRADQLGDPTSVAMPEEEVMQMTDVEPCASCGALPCDQVSHDPKEEVRVEQAALKSYLAEYELGEHGRPSDECMAVAEDALHGWVYYRPQLMEDARNAALSAPLPPKPKVDEAFFGPTLSENELDEVERCITGKHPEPRP